MDSTQTDILVSSLLSSARVLLFAGTGVYMDKLGFLPVETKRDVSRIIFNVLSPMLAFTALASTLDFTLLKDAWVLIIASIVHTLLAGFCVYLLTFVLSINRFQKTLIAAGFAGNTVNLPIVLATGLCSGSNQVTDFFAQDFDKCSETAIALVSIYSITTYFAIFVMAKLFLLADDPAAHSHSQELVEDRHRKESVEMESLEHRARAPLSPKRRGSQVVSVFPSVYSWEALNVYCPPPVQGIILGIIAAFIPSLQSTMFDSDNDLFKLSSAITLMGSATIPFTLFMLGSSLSQGPGGEIHPSHLFSVAVTRLLILPAMGIAFWKLFHTLGLFTSHDPLIEFVFLLESAMPSAMTLNVFSEMQGFAQKEVASILFYQYLASIVSITIWVSVFLMLI